VLALPLFAIVGIIVVAFTATGTAGANAGFTIPLTLAAQRPSFVQLVDAPYESPRHCHKAVPVNRLNPLSHFLELARFTQDLAAHVLRLNLSIALFIALMLVRGMG